MRTTLAGHVLDRCASRAADDGQETARDNPRRRREPLGDREDVPQRANGTNRPPLRHGVEQVPDDRRSLART